MGQIKLFIAASLDGYIARENHSLDWLDQLEHMKDEDYGYAEFLESVDILLIGRKTYEEVLGFGVEWPYQGKKSYVFTADSEFTTETPDTEVVNELTPEFITQLQEAESDIWLVGGGKLIASFLKLGAVDDILVSIIPVMLGNGIPLFPEIHKDAKLQLVSCESFRNGVVNLSYRLGSK